MRRREPSVFQAAIRQTRPFHSRGQEAAIGLALTYDAMIRKATALLEPHGITPQQYNVLRILRGAGSAGLPTLAIAERMIEQTPGITRLLDRLEAKKLVRRERCREDRRQMFVSVTPAGLTLLERLDEPVHALDAATVAGLNPGEQRRLVELLAKVWRTLHAGT